jgi:integrase
VDPATGRTRHRSVTVHGTQAAATALRGELVAAQRTGQSRLAALDPFASPTAAREGPQLPPGAVLVVGELLVAWREADHPWKPSTTVGYRSTVRVLLEDPIARARVMALNPRMLGQVVQRWNRAGASRAVTAARIRVLRSAVGWAWDERLIDVHPVRFMRGPGRVPPRRPLAEEEVRTLLATAELRLLEALANHDTTTARLGQPSTRAPAGTLHRAEQDLLLVRLAADTGARRGELAALQIQDLTGRVLRIDRAFSADVLTVPKSGHGRVMTVGASTADLWHTLTHRWAERFTEHGLGRIGPWLFSSDLAHRHRLGSAVLGHRFAAIRDEAGVPEASLHRLRHNVATFLVARGEVLQARNRLGHADAATTLREYSYAAPLTDQHVADAIDRLLLDAGTDAPDPRAGSFTGDRRARMPQSRA